MFPINALPLLKRIAPFAAVAAVVIAILLLTYCAGRDAGETGVELDNAKQTIKVQKDVGVANDKASDLRVEDKARITRENQELKDAIDNATSADDLRRRRGCAILRQQQLATGARLPAACGPEGRP